MMVMKVLQAVHPPNKQLYGFILLTSYNTDIPTIGGVMSDITCDSTYAV